MAEFKIITIDGPTGSGKSTVSRKIAKRFALLHLNSGYLFRAVGFLAAQSGLLKVEHDGFNDLKSLSSPELIDQLDKKLVEIVRANQFDFIINEDGETIFLLNKKEISSQLKENGISQLASRVGAFKILRHELVLKQREVAKVLEERLLSSNGLIKGLVLEGRDAGTVVFPEAKYKFYLDAPLELRAKRRFGQVADGLSLEEVIKATAERDHRDSTRDVEPLRAAKDSKILETGHLSADEVVRLIAVEVGLVD